MRLLLTGNCQVDGLHVFLARAMPQHEIRRLPHLATFFKEFSEEKIADDHAWADLVFFHHKHEAQDYPTKQPKIALSVWYQAGPFIIQTHDDDWKDLVKMRDEQGMDAAIAHAPVADLDYKRRWDLCLVRMMEKEHNELVPHEIRVSDLMEQGRGVQLQRTCNHPTSLVFREWALRLCYFLGEEPHENAISYEEALQEPNLAGLPCEESATSGAVRELGLRWGGRPEDEESGRGVARDRLSRL